MKTENNPDIKISNADLEMAGRLVRWLVMEGVCGDLREKNTAMCGDKSPSISWGKRLSAKQSLGAERLTSTSGTTRGKQNQE